MAHYHYLVKKLAIYHYFENIQRSTPFFETRIHETRVSKNRVFLKIYFEKF